MPVFTQKELEEHYDKLPEVLKQALFSVDVANKMIELGKSFGITIEKVGFMAEETGYIILGFTKPQEFVQRLVERLEVDEDKAKKIASKINHEVFLSLREALKTAYQVDLSEEEMQKVEITEEKPIEVVPILKPSVEPVKIEEKVPEPTKLVAPKLPPPKQEITLTRPTIPTIRREEFEALKVSEPASVKTEQITPPKAPSQIPPLLSRPAPPKLFSQETGHPQSIADSAKNWDNKAELMSRTILSVPPIEKSSPPSSPPSPVTPTPPAVSPSVDKKIPNKGFDPYRESTE